MPDWRACAMTAYAAAALQVAVGLAASPAQAACQRVGDAVTCTGLNGDSFITPDRVSLTVEPAGIVSNIPRPENNGSCPLSFPAIVVGDGSTVINRGAVIGTGVCAAGIVTGAGAAVRNETFIETFDNLGHGIDVGDDSTVTHLGVIRTHGIVAYGIFAGARARIDLAPGATIETDNASAIFAGSGTTVTAAGTITVRGPVSAGIDVAGDAVIANSATIDVSGVGGIGIRANGTVLNVANRSSIRAATPLVVGATSAGTGVDLTGSRIEFLNSGDISAQRFGVRVTALDDAQIVNLGTIGVAVDPAIAPDASAVGIVSSATALTSVINRGTIAGPGLAAITGGAGVEQVSNFGAIIGEVRLGAGDDSFVMQGGSRLDGRLDLGDGDDAAVLLNDGVFGGTFANVEMLRKLNPGTWTLTSDVAVTRTASVFDGGLRISGRLTAPQVQTFGRGTLSGAGTIQGSLVNDGVFAPDGGQQLRVAGDFHQTASGVFRFSPQAGATAPLAVDGAVMLDGTLALSGAAAALRPGGVFDLVAVTPGAPVTGRFARIDGLGPYFVTGALRRSADGRVIRLSIERQPYASAAQSPAQAAVGAALDAALARGSAGLQPIFDRLDRLSAAQAATDLDRLSPRTPVMAATAVEVALRTAQAAVGQWLELGPSDGVPGSFRVWGHAGRRTGTSRGDAGATFGMRIDHATAGLDYALPDGTRVGLALSGLDVGASLRAGGASIEAAPKLVAVTAGHAWPRWRMAGALMIGDANPSWRRDGLTGPNAARSDSDLAAAFATLTYAGNIGPFIVKPSATLHVSRVRADAAEESGGAALSTMADTRWSVRPEAGWRMVARPGPIHPYVGVAAAYEAGERDRDLTAMFRADPLAAFSLTGPAPRKLWLTVQAGANIELGPGIMARIGFDGVVNEPLAGRGFGAGLSYRW